MLAWHFWIITCFLLKVKGYPQCTIAENSVLCRQLVAFLHNLLELPLPPWLCTFSVTCLTGDCFHLTSSSCGVAGSAADPRTCPGILLCLFLGTVLSRMLDLWHCSYLTLVFFSPVLGFLVLLFCAFLFCEFMNGIFYSLNLFYKFPCF